MQNPDDIGSDGAQPAAPAVVVRHRSRWFRGLRWLLGLGLLLSLAIAGALAWLLASESGLQKAVDLAARASAGALQLEGARGRLYDGVWIERLRYRGADGDLEVTVEELQLRWQPRDLLSLRLVIAHLGAARVEVLQRASAEAGAAPQAPQSLQLPLGLEVSRLALGEFVLRSLPATSDVAAVAAAEAATAFSFSDLEARLRSDGRHHRIEDFALTLPQGRVQLRGELDGRHPFALDAEVNFSGEVERRALRARLLGTSTLLQPLLQLDAELDGLAAQAEVRLESFGEPVLQGLKLSTGEIDPAALAAGAPAAALVLDAELSAPTDGSSLLSGPIRIDNRQPGTVDAGGLPLRELTGVLHWKVGQVRLDALELALLGKGRIAGELGWMLPQETPDAAAPTTAPVGEAAAEAAPPEVPVQASGVGRITGTLQLADIELDQLDSRLPAQRLAGKVDAVAETDRQQAEVALGLGKARLEARADLRLPDGASAHNLEVSGRLRAIDPSAFIVDAPPAELNLDFDASGELPEAGLPQAAQLSFRIADSRFRGQPLRGQGRLRLEGEHLPELALQLQLAANRLEAQGAWGAAGDALALKLDAPELAAFDPGLGGRAHLTGTLRGTVEMPAGEFRISADGLRLPGEVRLRTIRGEGRLAAGADAPFDLALDLGGLGPLGTDADGIALPDWLASAQVRAEGRRDAHRIDLEVARPEEGGIRDRLRARLRGGLQTAADGGLPSWRGELSALDSAGRFTARLQAPAALELGSTAVRLGAAEVHAGTHGHIRLQETFWSPQEIRARGTLSGLVLDPPERPRRRGPGPLTLGADWNLRLGQTLSGEAKLFRESGDFSVEGELRTRLGLQTLQAVLTAQEDRLAFAVEAVGSEFGRLGGTASVRAQRSASGTWSVSPEAPLQGAAQLDMPSITWLGRLVGESLETVGRVQGAFSIGGTVGDPKASGRIEGRELQLALVDQGLQLSGGEFDLSFDRDRVRLERLRFVSPNRVRPRDGRIPFERLTATPGTLTASGELALDSGAGSFSFAAERLPLLQRDDRWMILSGSGKATTSWNSLVLDADFRADAGYLQFAESPPPSLSDDVVVLGRDEEKQGDGFGIQADVRVNLGKALYLSAMGLDTRLEGELRLRMAPGAPLTAVGTVATVGGTYRGYNQNLTIDRGIVNFQGPLDAPGLNIVALRKGLEVEAGVAVSGSARRPQVRLVSEPNVPDPEKLSWIVLGRAPDAASGADLGLLLPAAQALLGGPGGGMTDELSRSLGFDSFSIGQGELNSTSRTATSRVVGGGSTIDSGPSVSGQVLSLGKRLSSDLFLSFEQSLGGAEALVKLTYQLSRRLSLIARGGTDNSVDLNYSFSFR